MNLTSESDSDDPITRSPQMKQQQLQKKFIRIQTPKNPMVLEKERQMRFLLENFPKSEAMVNKRKKKENAFDSSYCFVCFFFVLKEIHNLLSKHRFDPDSAARELSEKMEVPLYAGGYKKWKSDLNLPDFHPDTATPTPQNGNNVAQVVHVKRKLPTTFGNPAKRKSEISVIIVFCFLSIFFV